MVASNVVIGALRPDRGSNQIVVTETYDGFPAQNVGLLIGDRIVTIDGNNVVALFLQIL